jgi:peptidoglycan/xylan/chitin deacetylase (PgdA/CDA1 family)
MEAATRPVAHQQAKDKLKETMNFDATLPLPSVLALAAGIAAAATTVGLKRIARPESQFFGQTIIAGKNPAEVALTFDDGPNGDTTLQLLEVLARHNARATFFLVGQHVQQQPEIVRAIHQAGHLLGNHTWTHPWLFYKTGRTIREELSRCNRAIEDITGAPVRYFRPPHGARRWAVLDIAGELGLATVQWNVMAMDWLPITPERMLANINLGRRLTQRKRQGANILLHDGDGLRLGADRTNTLRATETLLQHFAEEGRRITTVDSWDFRV